MVLQQTFTISYFHHAKFQVLLITIIIYLMDFTEATFSKQSQQ